MPKHCDLNTSSGPGRTYRLRELGGSICDHPLSRCRVRTSVAAPFLLLTRSGVLVSHPATAPTRPSKIFSAPSRRRDEPASTSSSGGASCQLWAQVETRLAAGGWAPAINGGLTWPGCGRGAPEGGFVSCGSLWGEKRRQRLEVDAQSKRASPLGRWLCCLAPAPKDLLAWKKKGNM